MEKRESGIDLFRCMGMLFVCGLHGFLYNGFYNEAQNGFPMWIADVFRWLFYGCNGMFMVLTGYLKSTKPLGRSYYKGLITVLVGYALTCVISYPIRYFLLGEEGEFIDWVDRLFSFSNYAWYVKMYVGLILISPVINLAMERLREPKELLWLLGTMVTMTALPSLTSAPVLPDYWVGIYPLTYYIIGGVIRRLRPEVPVWKGLLGAGVTAIGMGTASLISTDGGKFSDGFAQGGNGGFLTTLMVSLLFLGVYRVEAGPKFRRVLAWLSSGVLEGFLLSRLLDVWVYNAVSFWHTPENYWLIFICVTVPVFLISITAGHYVHKLAVRLTKKILV